MIIISTQIENSDKFKSQRMKFYDPLFSSDSIRKSIIDSELNSKIMPVIIEFWLDVNDEISIFDGPFQEKEPGYMKFKYSKDCYEWRQCKIKTQSNGKSTAKLSSNSIRNKCKIYIYNKL